MASSGEYSSSDEVDPDMIVNPDRIFTQMGFPVIILGQQYCSSHPVELLLEVDHGIEEKFKITSADGVVLFRAMKEHDHHFVMFNDQDQPVMAFINKHHSAHKRRRAFKGDSTNHDDLLFSVIKKKGRHSMKFDVFLSSNFSEGSCNFRIYDNYRDGTSTIFAGDKTTVLAKLHTQVEAHHHHHGIVAQINNYKLSVSPNVDSAFVAALAMIREDILASRKKGHDS